MKKNTDYTPTIRPGLLTPAQTAAELGMTEATLAVWRCTRRYNLPWVKIGARVYYRISDIEAFLRSRTFGAAPENA